MTDDELDILDTAMWQASERSAYRALLEACYLYVPPRLQERISRLLTAERQTMNWIRFTSQRPKYNEWIAIADIDGTALSAGRFMGLYTGNVVLTNGRKRRAYRGYDLWHPIAMPSSDDSAADTCHQ